MPRSNLVAGKTTSIRVNTKLVDEAMRVLGAKSRTDAARIALEKIVNANPLRRFLKKYGGKGEFANGDE